MHVCCFVICIVDLKSSVELVFYVCYDIYIDFKGTQSLRLIFFILKVANIRCFILIAVEFFHNIIRI